MATQRRTGTRAHKASKAAKKPAPKKAARKPAAKKTVTAKKAAAARRPVARAARPKAAAKPAAKPVKGAPAKAAKAAKPAPKPKPVVRQARPAPEVRPIGVLPPESRARTAAPIPVSRPRPMGGKPAPRKIDPTGAQGVTEKDNQEFEQRLLAERAKILKQMGHLETTVLKVNPRDSAGDLSGYSFHMADAGTDAMEREKAFLFASAEGRILMEINDALQRLYRGEFGTCEICGKPIARARLEAMPYARLCVSCKEKEEKAGRLAGQIGQ